VNTSDLFQATAATAGLVAVLVAAGFALVRGRQIARLERTMAALRGNVHPLPESRTRRLTGAHATPGATSTPHPRLRVALVVVGVGVLIAGGALVRLALEHATAGHASGSRVTTSGSGADPQTVIPAQLPALGNPGSYTVAVLNAASPTAPLATQAAASVSAAGYSVGTVGNAPTVGLAQSVVMWAPGEQLVAERVAHALGITVVGPLDGLTTQDIGGAEAVVIVGRDRLSS